MTAEYDRDALAAYVAYIQFRFDTHGKIGSMHVNKSKFPSWVWDRLACGPYLYELGCGHIAQTRSPRLHKDHGCARCDNSIQAVVSVTVDGVKYPRAIVSEIRRINSGNPTIAEQEKIARQRKLKKAERRGPAAAIHHRDYRAKLIAEGCSVELADKATMEYRWNGLRQRAGDARYRRIRERLDGPRRLSDAQYKPARVDPVLRGVARATGETARAIRSGKTLTKWQYEGTT